MLSITGKGVINAVPRALMMPTEDQKGLFKATVDAAFLSSDLNRFTGSKRGGKISPRTGQD